MHSEHDALPVVSGNGDSSLFVAATLAALVLAGSAFVYHRTYEQHSEHGKLTTQPSQHEQSTPDHMDNEKDNLLDAHSLTNSSSPTRDPDSKESKSSRSKDRRRRGKDPLKEILKGGKKPKTTTTTPIKHLFTSKPDLDDLNVMPTPSTLTPTPNSLSRASGKRTQQDDSLLDTPSSVHSCTSSEASQCDTDQPHPHRHIRGRTALSTPNFNDRALTPSQSSSSSHNGTENDITTSEETNPHIPLPQTRETHLSAPTPTIFSTTRQYNDDLNEIVDHSVLSYSSGMSSATNTTTASCVITPATSPSLSLPAPSPVTANSELAPNKASDSDPAPKNNAGTTSPHALDSDTKSRSISRKQQPFLNLIPSKSKSKTKIKINPPNSWNLDSTGEAVLVPPSSSIPVSAMTSAPLSVPTSSLIAAPAFPPDIGYRKPPRLQAKSLWSKNTKNDASMSIPGSVSHPSLISPTSGSFVPPNLALLSPSISSSLLPNRVSKVAEEDESEEVDERGTTDDSCMQLEFPTLNPIVPTSSSPAGGPTAGPSNNRPATPRRAPSSRGPPTPSGSTPPPPPHPSSGSGSVQSPSTQTPIVSTQTQLASLRGALEAARLREEKHKSEIEKYTKELEALRWENATSRRGEVELQNHVQHLMHQLQMYTSLLTSASPPLASQQQPSQQTQGPMGGSAGLLNSGDGAVLGSGSGNGPTSPGTPAAVIPGPPVSSPPMHLHMLPPLQLSGLSSPLSASGVFPPPVPGMHPAPSPYFPYPMSPLSLHHTVMPSPHPMFTQQFHHMQQQFLQFQQYQQHQPHMQNQSQSPSIQAQQPNLISMFHPPSLPKSSYQSGTASSSSSMASGSGSSSRPGTESTGSSPDLNGSPSPVPGSVRARTRTQIANGYIGGWNGDGWVIGSVGIDGGDEEGHENTHESEEQAKDGNDDEDEVGYNEILADAILKRPDRIGVRSRKKNKQAPLEEEPCKDREPEQPQNEVLDAVEPLTEFKFPSLSDFGNVFQGGHNQASSSSSSMVSSQTHEDLGSNMQVLADRPLHDVVEVAMSQDEVELDIRNENQLALDTTGSSPRTPRKGESESNVIQPSVELNWVEKAEGQ